MLNTLLFVLNNKSLRLANSVYPDEMAHYEPSHLDLHLCKAIGFSNQCRSRRDGSLEAVSSGSALFAKVYVLARSVDIINEWG